MSVFEELMAIRGAGVPQEPRSVVGEDPVLPSRYPLGQFAADIMMAIGVAANDLIELSGRPRCDLALRVDHAAAALKSYQYLKVGREDINSAFATQLGRQKISTPHPTKDGRFFLPHMGLPHLAERILNILGCDYELEAVKKALLRFDALELENAVAEKRGCGAMVRSAQEWAEHPQGQLLASLPVVQVEKIGESDPVPLSPTDRALGETRVLDLTRILAGPTCARTLAEHGADVLMVTAAHLPQSDFFVMDTSHGKRTTFLDLNVADEREQLMQLIAGADVFSQGYRPGVMARQGLGPQELASIKPGIIYVSMNCYGDGGPMSDRAGWEQLAQTVTGIADENNPAAPALLPAAACDYSTGYLAAFGTMLALARRAKEGGSYHVKASLCQSGMMLQRQHRVSFDEQATPQYLSEIVQHSETPYGSMQHLGPFLQMNGRYPQWSIPSSPLGSHEPRWLS